MLQTTAAPIRRNRMQTSTIYSCMLLTHKGVSANHLFILVRIRRTTPGCTHRQLLRCCKLHPSKLIMLHHPKMAAAIAAGSHYQRLQYNPTLKGWRNTVEAGISCCHNSSSAAASTHSPLTPPGLQPRQPPACGQTPTRPGPCPHGAAGSQTLPPASHSSPVAPAACPR